MKAHVFFWPVLAYIFVYDQAAKKALKSLGENDLSGLWAGECQRPGLGRSLAILRMLFDSSLPEAHHPIALKRSLVIARIMLAFLPVVFITMLALIAAYATG